jgi:broad specificity phosphatase PhoE
MESLNQLIERLQHLHLEQALENIFVTDNDVEHDDVVEHAEPNTTPVLVAVPVPVPVSTVIAPVSTVFHIGQRVYITSRITHVLVRCAMEADRTAIVTHFTASRIGIRTINGFHTHQHPKNLRPL